MDAKGGYLFTKAFEKKPDVRKISLTPKASTIDAYMMSGDTKLAVEIKIRPDQKIDEYKTLQIEYEKYFNLQCEVREGKADAMLYVTFFPDGYNYMVIPSHKQHQPDFKSWYVKQYNIDDSPYVYKMMALLNKNNQELHNVSTTFTPTQQYLNYITTWK